jgi:hypothetical protein
MLPREAICGLGFIYLFIIVGMVKTLLVKGERSQRSKGSMPPHPVRPPIR